MAKRTVVFSVLYLLFFYFFTLKAIEGYDIVIYGGTSAGVIAAVQAAKMGNSVVLISTGNHIGGMTINGLGWVDVKNPGTIGGLSIEFFNRVWQFYQQDSSWIWEAKHPIKGQLMQLHPEDPCMWVLEPHVGEMIFNDRVTEANIPVIYNEQLNRDDGVQMKGQSIIQIEMESGRAFQGKMFIDATYEGDLMAASKVSYRVGREPNSLYQETVNGIQPNKPFKTSYAIDPYLVEGDPQSGLLPRVYSNAGGNAGEGDDKVEAYVYRRCLTDVVQNRVPVTKPSGYDEAQYEIVFRAIEAGMPKEKFFKLDLLPNRKTDSNNNGMVSTDYVGMNWNYPEADYATRKQIALAHELWQRGLIWTLQNHSRVPESVKAYYAPWGLPNDEFVDNNNWPYDLYIREARRMVSSVVIDEQTVLGKVQVPDSIGFGFYDMDSHIIKYIVNQKGGLESEGGVYKKVKAPFPISYQAIIPIRNECKNLLVPICVSSTHSAYGAIRMEPTFMVLGQSAATAASLAILLNVALQDLPYEMLRKQLIADGQVLEGLRKPD